MSWQWRTERVAAAAGRAVGLDQTFNTQGEAETWLGEFYPALLESGVRSVSLYEADRLVYGPMSLEPEA